MKTNFNRVLSIICILSMLLSCVPFVGVQAADELSIITAQFVPYDQEIRVLADIPDDYTAKVYVAGTPINCEKTVTSDGTLLTSSNFVPSVYGIVPVKLEATNGVETLSDTQNVKIVKAFSKAESLSEDFEDFELVAMQSDGDNVIKDLFADNDVTMVNLPGYRNGALMTGRYLDILSSYDADNTNVAVYRFEEFADKTLPTFRANPVTDGVGGIIELSLDIYPTSKYVRMALDGKNTKSKDISFGSNGTSTYQLLNYDTQCFGNSDVPVVGNTWYNIRFLMNVNELTYELYVNNKFIEKDVFSYATASSSILGISYFDISAGVQGAAGATKETPVRLAVDNIKVLHTATGAVPSAMNYTMTADSEPVSLELTDAKIPFSSVYAINTTLNAVVAAADGDIMLADASGNKVDADISVETVGTGSVVTVIPSALEPGESYNIVLSENVTYSGTAYGAPTKIPFTAIAEFAILAPFANTTVNKGEIVNIKATTKDTSFVDLYINDEFITTLTPDSENSVSYAYDTTNESLGNKEIKLIAVKNDNTTEIINSSFIIANEIESDITSLDTFADFVSATEYKTAHSNIRDSINAITRETEVSSAAIPLNEKILNHNDSFSIHYVAAKAAKGKAVWMQDTFDKEYSGRIVFEHDLYIEDTTGTLNYCFTGSSGTTTGIPFYALNDSSLFSGGKIGTHARDYGNKWNSIKIVIDTVKQSSEVYFNGEIVTSNNNFTGTLKGLSYSNMDSCANLRITYLKGSSATIGNEYFAFAVDNWRVYKEYPLPEFENVSATERLADGQLIPSAADSFSIDISNAIYANKESLLDNFKVTADGENVNIENTVLSDGTLTFDVAALPENADLEFVIGKDTLLYDGVTTIGSDVVFNLKVADDTGLYAKRYISLTADKAKAVFKTDSFSDKSVVLIIATYADDVLTNITTQPINAAEADITTLALPISGSTHAKAFIWGSLDTAYPVSAGEIKVSVK